MSAVKGHDMSHHWRLVSVDGGPVSGTFWVQRPRLTAATWVIAVDVTVWDEDRTWGLVLIPGDLSAMVKDGVVDLAVLRPRGNEEFVREREADIKAAVLAAANAVEWPADAEAGESR